MTVLEKEIRLQLHKAGYDLNPEELEYDDVAEYLNIANSDGDRFDMYYSIQDWIKDTSSMYPELLVRL